MRLLSKSRLISFRQCAKRLWLELKRPELAEVSPSAQARFEVGHTVGAVARRLYDPQQQGALVDAKTEGFDAALKRSVELLATRTPLFEAGYAAEGALAFADVMVPVGNGSKPAWRMIEVKSATSVKDYHRDDAAIQAFVARRAGVPLEGIAVAHIDSSWTYPGGGVYAGLLVECDLTEETRAREGEVSGWIKEARTILELRDEPRIGTGGHCTDPFECPFAHHCHGQEPQAEYPVEWLPRVTNREAKAAIETKAVTDLRQMPDALLNDLQRRVKQHTLSGQPYFDQASAAAELAAYRLPVAFLDFETITFAVPVWAGTRPYQQIPFQFSLHRLAADGALEHEAFLDVSGADPSRAFAEALIEKCSGTGAVFVYNVGFERSRVTDLARWFPDLAQPLEALAARLVDLLPVAQRHFYHPSQHGSWSIKQVLPAMVPELDYGALEGVKDGNAAMDAYREAIAPQTTAGRRAEIRQQLLRYCELDTYALVRVWQQLSGQTAVIPAK